MSFPYYGLKEHGLKLLVQKCDWNKFISFCHLPACRSTYFCQKKSLGIFNETGCWQNEKNFSFQVSETPQLWKALTLFKRIFIKRVSEKMSKVCIFNCWNLRTFKISHFCQKKCLSRFSPSGKFTKKSKIVNVFVFHPFFVLLVKCTFCSFPDTWDDEEKHFRGDFLFTIVIKQFPWKGIEMMIP